MLTLEEKEYDLNFLCSFTFDFQMLREILLKLAESNQEMQEKLKNLENLNQEKDKRLSDIENKLNILIIENTNLKAEQEEKKDKDKKEEKEEKVEEEKEEKKEEKEIKEEKKEEKEEIKIIKDDNPKPIIKTEKIVEKEKESESESEEEKKKENIKPPTKIERPSQFLEPRSSIIQQMPQVSHETIKKLMLIIKENTEKISKIEKNFTNNLNNAINDFEIKHNELSEENEKAHKLIKERIKNITDKLYDYNDKMDGLIVKTAPLDTLSIFRDNGNEDIDATKVMVKMLEEKVTKKIELVEKKTKTNVDEDKFKLKIEELEDMINKMNKELKRQNELIKMYKNNKNNEEDIQKLKDLIDQKYNDALKIIEDLSSKIKNGDLLDDKLEELLKKMNSQKEDLSSNDILDQPKIEESGKKIDDDLSNALLGTKKKIRELNKKLNEMDDHYKNLFKNSDKDIADLKGKIKEINSLLDTKLTKNDIKHLINKSEEYNDSIQFLQESINDINKSIAKLAEHNPNLMQRIENLTNDIYELRGRKSKETSQRPIDVSRFVEENKLREITKKINKELDTINNDRNYIWNNINEINNVIKLVESKERVLKLEDEMNMRFSDLIEKISKKYVEKQLFNKYIRTVDIKLKSLDTSQKDADSWILAKQPVGCFNCATCEANIKNISSSNDYIPWNKYPQAEKQYHLGKGFSRLLKKIGTNFYSTEKKEMFTDNESTSTYFKNMTSLQNSNGHFFFNLNNKETLKEDLPHETIIRNIKNYKLPNLKNKKEKKVNIPLTDEESDFKNNSMDNSDSSPKIMKITKRTIEADFSLISRNQKIVDPEHKSKLNYTSVKSKSKLDRVKSLPIYDNAS